MTDEAEEFLKLTPKEWIKLEREELWNDLAWAINRAVRRPDPTSPPSWSVEMDGIADRIRSADLVLGDHISWKSLPLGDVLDYYKPVTGEDLPDEAFAAREKYRKTQLL